MAGDAGADALKKLPSSDVLMLVFAEAGLLLMDLTTGDVVIAAVMHWSRSVVLGLCNLCEQSCLSCLEWVLHA